MQTTPGGAYCLSYFVCSLIYGALSSYPLLPCAVSDDVGFNALSCRGPLPSVVSRSVAPTKSVRQRFNSGRRLPRLPLPLIRPPSPS